MKMERDWAAVIFQPWVMDGLLSITMLLGIAAVVSAIVGGRHPPFRHALWLGTLVVVAALLPLGALQSLGWRPTVWRVPSPQLVLNRLENRLLSESGMTDGKSQQPLGVTVTTTGSSSVDPKKQAHDFDPTTAGSTLPKYPSVPYAGLPWHLSRFALGVWLSGVVFLAARLGVGWRRLRRLTKDASPWCDSNYSEVLRRIERIFRLKHSPVILLTSQINSPFVSGVFHPRIYLPRELVGASGPDELAQILIHELAHVKRKDAWVLALERLVTLPLWFHPLVHWMNRELDRAREELCDNHVLCDSHSSDYARTLLRLAQLQANRWGLVGRLSILLPEHRLVSRIRWLLDKGRDRRTFLATGERLVTASFIVLVAIGASLVRMSADVSEGDSLSGAAKRTEYRFIETPPQFTPSKIDRRGQVVGMLNSRPAIWSREQGLRELAPFLGAAHSVSVINDLGNVAGYSVEGNNNWRPFVTTADGNILKVPDLGGTQAPPAGMNNRGQIVGWSSRPGQSSRHAFLYSPGKGTQDLGTLGGRESGAMAINDNGWVVGGADLEVGRLSRPFLWRPGRGMISLGVLPGYSDGGWANDVNDAGHVVGSTCKAIEIEFVDPADPHKRLTVNLSAGTVSGSGKCIFYASRPFLWTEERGMVALACPSGFDSVHASRINNRDEILLEAFNDIPKNNDPGSIRPFSHSKLSYFLITRGGIQALPERPGFASTRYSGLNDDGLLIGFASTNGRDDQAGSVKIVASQGFMAIPKK